MKFFVYSRSAITTARPHDAPNIIISITNAPEDRAPVGALSSTNLCRGVLRLSFPDAEVASERFPENELFSPAHAEQVWAFVRQHLDGLEHVIVECDAGLSRSPAVAAALARVLTGDCADFLSAAYEPNMRVYRTLLGSSAYASEARPTA